MSAVVSHLCNADAADNVEDDGVIIVGSGLLLLHQPKAAQPAFQQAPAAVQPSIFQNKIITAFISRIGNKQTRGLVTWKKGFGS